MGELGCLKDGHFQNLQVEGHVIFHTTETIHNIFGDIQIHGNETVSGLLTVTGVTSVPTIVSTGIQRLATDAILTIADDTSLVLFAHVTSSTSRIITLPAATVGRQFKILWEITQANGDRVLTAAGTDDITGCIFTSDTGNAAGDGDVFVVTAGTVTITCIDNVYIGSIIDFYCGVAGTWVINGQIVIDAGVIPVLDDGI